MTMDCGGFYAELKGWQQSIGAVLGFVALLSGALFNAHLNRKRDDRLKVEEASSLAAALFSETLALRSDLARLARGISGREAGGFWRDTEQKFDAAFFEAFDLPPAVLFPALVTKLGLLPPRVTKNLASFHGFYAEAKGNIDKLIEDEQRTPVYSVTWVLRPAQGAVDAATVALERLNALAGFNTPVPPVDLGYTEALIEMEDLQHEENYKSGQ